MRDLQLQCDVNVRELQQLQVKLLPDSDHRTRYWLYQIFKHCIFVCVRMRNATCWLNTRPRNWRSWMRNRAWSWRSGGRSSDPGRRYYTVARQEHSLLPFSSKVQIILLIYSSVHALNHLTDYGKPWVSRVPWIIWNHVICNLQALEDEFTRKLQEQEVFFKMTGESECLNPSTQSRISKFYPIPSVHSTGFWEWILQPYLHPLSVSDLGFHSAVFILRKVRFSPPYHQSEVPYRFVQHLMIELFF